MTTMQLISTSLAAIITIYYGQTLFRRHEYRALELKHLVLWIGIVMWAVVSWTGLQ